MGDVIHTVDVDVDVQTAYNQWTQFEEFPRFMEGVESVEQLDDRRLMWKVDIAGIDREFETEITEQTPDQRIAWTSTSGVEQGGVVTFHRLDDHETRVTLQMVFEPEGVVEQLADLTGAVSMRVKGDLERFKEFIEERRVETGAWRGEIAVDDRYPPTDFEKMQSEAENIDLDLEDTPLDEDLAISAHAIEDGVEQYRQHDNTDR